MKKRKAAGAVLCLALCCSLLAGCWDKVEIEDRLFVLAMGLDKTGRNEAGQGRLSISYVSPVLSSSKEGGGPDFKTYKTISDTLTMAPPQLMARFAKLQYFGHCRVILFGEELMEDEKLMLELVDALKRTHEMHKSMYVFIVPGKAEAVFEVEPMYDKLLATYIAGIEDNSLYSARIMRQTLADFLVDINRSGGNTLIPRLLPGKNEVKVCGAGVIKNNKLIGYLSEEEGTVQNWLSGKAEGGSVLIYYQGVGAAFRYFTFKRKIKLDGIEDGKLHMTYYFETEGSVEEYIEGKEILNDALLRDMEKTVEKLIKDNSQALIEKYQKDFKVDLIGAGDFLSKYHPDVYKEIEKDYPQYFTDKMAFDVVVTAKIRRVGLAK